MISKKYSHFAVRLLEINRTIHRSWLYLAFLVFILIEGPSITMPSMKIQSPPIAQSSSTSHFPTNPIPQKDQSLQQRLATTIRSRVRVPRVGRTPPRVITTFEELTSVTQQMNSLHNKGNGDNMVHNTNHSSSLLRRPLQRLKEWGAILAENTRGWNINRSGFNKRRNPLEHIVVVANTTCLSQSHPTIQLVIKRLQENSKPSKRCQGDSNKVALCIEGGGMRGCVSAGAVAALNFLGLNDAVDVVYGSSAGAMIGAYFVSRQYSGLNIYYDVLPACGKEFIDMMNLLPALGIPIELLSMPKRRLRSLLRDSRIGLMSSFGRSMNDSLPKEGSPLSLDPSNVKGHHDRGHEHGNHQYHRQRPVPQIPSVLNLNFLLENIMKERFQFDWQAFAHNEKLQPLRIITSNAKTLSSVVLRSDHGHFHDLDSLAQCIRASMLIPGVTEPMLAISSESNSSFVTMHPPSSSISTLTSIEKKTTLSKAEQHSGNRTSYLVGLADIFPLFLSPSFAAPLNFSSLRNGNNLISPRSLSSLISKTVLSTALLPPLTALALAKTAKNSGTALWGNVQNQWKSIKEFTESIISNDSATLLSEEYDDSEKIPSDSLSPFKRGVFPVMFHFFDRAFHYGNRWWLNRKKRISSKRRLSDHSFTEQEISTAIDEYENTTESHLCDALLCEPIPYRSAVQEANHLIVLRTKPDFSRVLGRRSGAQAFYERRIAKNFFHRHRAKDAIGWMLGMEHLRVYAEDVLLCNEGAIGREVNVFGNSAYILPIAPVNASEVRQFETNRETILEGMRSGARRVIELFLPAIIESTENSELLKDLSVEDIVNQLFPLPTPLSKEELKRMKTMNVTRTAVQGARID